MGSWLTISIVYTYYANCHTKKRYAKHNDENYTDVIFMEDAGIRYDTAELN